MKTKDFLLVVLLLVVVFLATTMVWQMRVQNATERADTLATALAQVNELADERSAIVVQINEVLIKTGYSHLQRKIIKKVEEE